MRNYSITRVESHSAANTAGLKIKGLVEWLFASRISFQFLRALGPGWTTYPFTKSVQALDIKKTSPGNSLLLPDIAAPLGAAELVAGAIAL